ALFIPFLPMLPSQILLVNLLSDFPLVAVASDKVDLSESRKPKFHQLKNFIPLIITLALISTIFDLIFFYIFHEVEPPLLRTLWFIESVLTEIFLIFSIRTSRFFLKGSMPSIILILFSIATVTTTIFLPFTAFGQKAFYFVAPPIPKLLTVLSLILLYFSLSEAAKLIYFRQKRNHRSAS
ncbi:MAG: cation transporting ATPase C-terminal domain-containing protein, partial [bacterium]